MTRGSRSTLVLLVTTATVGAMSAAPAQAATAAERPTAQLRGAPWCGKTVWRSGLWKKSQILKRYDAIIRIADKVDTATDLAALALAAFSVSTLAAPSAVVKLVAKLGKGALKKVIGRLRADTVKVKHKKVGVRVRVGCAWGVIPYPSVGVYTP